MKTFMGEDFLLENETAKKLFDKYAKNMPIYDYHCHLSPKEIAEDKKYENITEIWLYGDHYKWRYMRSMGVDEKYCTGNASDYEKFFQYAKCIAYAAGNPLYHWTHLELQRFFGIYEPLNEKSAPKIWEKANEIIKSGDFTAQKLIEKSNVYLIGTTDDPVDSLEYHQKLKNFSTKVVPTFRPDKASNIENSGFSEYIKLLEDKSGIKIKKFADLKAAISSRMDHFAKMGSKISDHSVSFVPFNKSSDEEIDQILARALAGGKISADDEEKYKTAFLLFCAREYAKRGWVLQLHIAALRNNNTKMFKNIGADTGFDSIDDNRIAKKLSMFMDELDKDDLLPKTVLYSLNPNDNYTIGTMLGNFQCGGIKGKIQMGSAWWFNDNIDGMVNQIKALGNLGALSAFVGMLTDSRSFLSYPRHEYFRRILCNIIGTWVENGEFSSDEDILKEIIEGISFNNAKAYFGM
ncbi:MAG: glucuronate isomerase [Oscillospiraceae bacterium]|nr:glucuronate isomerase [Oscillospiraceae bacterium]